MQRIMPAGLRSSNDTVMLDVEGCCVVAPVAGRRAWQPLHNCLCVSSTGAADQWLSMLVLPAAPINPRRCLCKLLDGIQDHYTYAQPGIQRTVFHTQELVRWAAWRSSEVWRCPECPASHMVPALRPALWHVAGRPLVTACVHQTANHKQHIARRPSVCRRVEEPVALHLEKEGLQFIQFAFRWVNCLLLREVPFTLAVRLWDTYLAEGCAVGHGRPGALNWW